MANFDPIQSSINAGELTPLLSGAVDLAKYKSGLAIQQGFLGLTQGPVMLRPGTRYIAFTKNSAQKARLMPFIFSGIEAFQLEFGNYYVRFYQGQQQVMSGGVPYEIVTPYSSAEVLQLNSTQSADIIYLWHPNHVPFMLMHYGTTNWELQPLPGNGQANPIMDGPYLDENATATTLTPSSTSGAITLTAAPSPTELIINGGFLVRGNTPNGSGGWQSDWAWTHGASWVLQSGFATKTPGDTNVLSQALPSLIAGGLPGLLAGQSYIVTFNVTVSAGSITPKLGGAAGAAVTASGPVSQTIVAGSNGLLEFYPDSGGLFSGTIDPVSVQIVPSKTGTPFFYPQHVGSVWQLYYYQTPGSWAQLTRYTVGQKVYAICVNGNGTAYYAVLRCIVAGTSGPTIGYPYSSNTINIDFSLFSLEDTFQDGSVTWLMLNRPTASASSEKCYAWDYLQVTGYVDAWTVKAQVVGTLGQDIATVDWREGAWSDYRGYPTCGTFHLGRFYAASNANQPQTVWGSKVGDFYNFTPQDNVTDDGPITFTLDSDQVNQIQWLKSSRMLIIGTGASVWVTYGSESNYQITPSDITAREDIGEGSTAIQPIRTGPVLLYIENNGDPTNPGCKLRELSYNYITDNYVSPDLSLMSEHLLRPGVSQIDMQHSPHRIIWGFRPDGMLLSMIYESNEKVMGWAEHPMANGKVESVAVIPGQYQDELWMIVNRTLNGETVRCVEMMERIYWQQVSSPENLADAFFVDCGGTVTSATPTMAVTGFSWLANMAVNILADGKPHRPLTVGSHGSLTLDYPASQVQVGLPLTNQLLTLRPEGGSEWGTAQGKKKRVAKVSIRLVDSWGGYLGPDSNNQEQICPRDSTYQSEVPGLVNGDLLVGYKGAYETDGQIMITQDLPLPFTVAAIMPRLTITES